VQGPEFKPKYHYQKKKKSNSSFNYDATLRKRIQQGAVAHASNLSCSEDRDEIGKTAVRGKPGQKVSETLSQFKEPAWWFMPVIPDRHR
jgi:hypothetical protein